MKRFAPKPISEPRKERSAAQEAATERSFRIFKLRGLYELARMLSPDRCTEVRLIIDDELVSLGAESQADREAQALALDQPF